MAINPNTDFTAGAVLTAAQQNRFPRGIVALTVSTAASNAIGTTETVTLTSSTFTAVANRYYKITYFEPVLQASVTPPFYITARIRLTNATGTIYQYADLEPVVSSGSDGQMMTMTAVTTLSAGSTVIVGTLRASSNTVVAFGNADARRILVIEDIGPA